MNQLIHRIWLDDPLPDRFARFGREWERLHPGWVVVDWTDSQALPELTNRGLFDRAAEFYPKDWKRFQADLLRLELLDRFGGVYADCDIKPLRNIEPLLDGQFAAAYSPQTWKGRHPVTNAWMVSPPDHPLVEACIAQAPRDAEEYRGRPLARSVGPWLITRQLYTPWPDVHIHPSTVWGEWLHHDWNSGRRRRGGGV